MNSQETHRLDDIASRSVYALGANGATIKYSFNILKRFIGKGDMLELGPAEGVMTELLLTTGNPLTCVDGSVQFCHELKIKYPQLDVVNSLFEDYIPSKKFSCIILGHVLEHVEDPLLILNKIGNWLTEDGVIFAAVPNAKSIHRAAGVKLKLLETVYSLNDSDLYNGHRRVYDYDTLRQDFINAGLTIQHSGGYWLKPLSNKQIEEQWSEEMLNVFMELGELYPDIAAEIYVLATK